MSSTKLDYNSLNPNSQKVKFQPSKFHPKNLTPKIPKPKIPNPTPKNATSKTLRIGELGARAGNLIGRLRNKEAGKLGTDALKFRKLESYQKFDFY